MQNQTVQEGKTMAVISYVFWLGLIIAIYMNNKDKNPFTSFHIRQSFGILLLNLAAGFAFQYMNHTLGFIIAVTTVILWILGSFAALKGEEKEVPLFGKLFQDLFKGLS